jgi:hypothetical protein
MNLKERICRSKNGFDKQVREENMSAIQRTAQIRTRKELLLEMTKEKNCFQIRESLDAIFSGSFPLETASRQTKLGLFIHLESCEKCCRAFDARVRYSPNRRNRIY